MNSLKNVNSQDVDYILDYVKVLEAASASLFGAFFEVATLFKSQIDQGELATKLVGGNENSSVWLVADEDIAAEILADFAKTNVENAKTALKTEQSDFENFDLEEYMLASLLVSDFASGFTSGFASASAAGSTAGSPESGLESAFPNKKINSLNGEAVDNKVFSPAFSEAVNPTTKTSNVGFSWDIPSEFDVLVDLMQGVYGINNVQSGSLSQKVGNSQNGNNFNNLDNSPYGNVSMVFENLNQPSSNLGQPSSILGQLGSNFGDEKTSKTQTIEDFANEIAGIFSSGLAASRQSLPHKVQK